MNIKWVSRAAAAWFVAAGLLLAGSPPAAAQSAPSDGDYVQMSVPDMRQAVEFFRDVLNCEVISAQPATGADAPAAALMNCAHGSIVELRPLPAGRSKAHQAGSVAFATNDAAAASAWLHSRHVAVQGTPKLIRSGPDAGRIAVSFLAPWGQPLQLVGPVEDGPVASTRLAAQ